MEDNYQVNMIVRILILSCFMAAVLTGFAFGAKCVRGDYTTGRSSLAVCGDVRVACDAFEARQDGSLWCQSRFTAYQTLVTAEGHTCVISTRGLTNARESATLDPAEDAESSEAP
jgi:hypothetical protein